MPLDGINSIRSTGMNCFFSVELQEVQDGSFGANDEKREWTGMIGEVHRGAITILITLLSIHQL